MGIPESSLFEVVQALKDEGIRLASIWAQDRSRVLGSGTDMLWHVPADFKHFKSSTTGCPIIMGRRSWEALGGPLPQRTNIVLTRDESFAAPGALVVHSLDEALLVARHHLGEASTIWITGGAQIYADTMHIVDELIVTELDMDVVPHEVGSPTDADTQHVKVVRAPLIDPNIWRIDLSRSDPQWQERSGDARWKVITWVRR